MITTSSLVPDEMLPGCKGSSLDSYDSPLDQQRAASMADEGGVSAAETDTCEQCAAAERFLHEHEVPPRRTGSQTAWIWGLVAAAFAFKLVTGLLSRRTA